MVPHKLWKARKQRPEELAIIAGFSIVTSDKFPVVPETCQVQTWVEKVKRLLLVSGTE